MDETRNAVTPDRCQDAVAVILAAGNSARMGRCKALLPWGEKTCVEAVAAGALAGGCSRCVVVTGADHDAIARVVERPLVTLLRNPNPGRGMFSSIQCGVNSLGARERLLLCLVDQPAVAPELVARLLAWPEQLAALVWNGIEGHPVHVPARHLAELRAMPDDATMQDFMARHASATRRVESAERLEDFDTAEEYAAAAPALPVTGCIDAASRLRWQP